MLSIYKSHIDLLGDTEGLTLVTDLLSLLEGCPYQRGVLISGVNFCDRTCCPYYRGLLIRGLTLVTEPALLIRGVSLLEGCPY